MRKAFGSEQWFPSAEDLEEIRKAEPEMKRMRKQTRTAYQPEATKPDDLNREDVDLIMSDQAPPLFVPSAEPQQPAAEVEVPEVSRPERARSRSRSRSPPTPRAVPGEVLVPVVPRRVPAIARVIVDEPAVPQLAPFPDGSQATDKSVGFPPPIAVLDVL